MTITIKSQTERQIEIPVPCFWKKCSLGIKTYVAVIDEETFAKIFVCDEWTSIQNGDTGYFKGDIQKAQETYDLCTEEDFMFEYNKALKSLSLAPSLISVPDMGPWNEHLKEV